MIRFDTLPSIGIECVDPNASRGLLRVRARQVSAFMNSVHRYYRDELNLTRIDPEPFPSPNNHQETSWRISRFRASGEVEVTGLQFLLALQLDKNGNTSAGIDAIAGLLVTHKPEGLCIGVAHTPTEIVEWDVAKQFRKQGFGLGRFLLQQGLQAIHPEDSVVLDVAEANTSARTIYEHYGFTYASESPRYHGIFDGAHLRMSTPARQLQQRLGILAAQ